MRLAIIIPVLAALTAQAGCSESGSAATAQQKNSSSGKQSGTSSRNAGGKPGAPAARVAVATVEDGALTDHWTFLGRVEAAQSAALAAAVPGPVLAVNVREGDRVSRGQPVLTIDSAPIRADLGTARAREEGMAAEAAVAERQLARVAEVQYPTISTLEKERFELAAAKTIAALATLRAEIRRLEIELARHTLQAPFAGVVSARHVDPGAWVSVGQPVLALLSLDELEIHVEVSAELGRRVEVGQKVTLRGPTPVSATVAGVVGALGSETRTMPVRLVPAERPAWLIAGMPVDVEFSVPLGGDGQGTVLVPRDALIRGPVNSRVMKLDHGKARAVNIEIIATAENRALVRGDGLRPGDKVVVRGNERLRPDQPVDVVD